MLSEELKKRLIGSIVLILFFMIIIPYLISGKNINKNQDLVSEIEQQRSYTQQAKAYENEITPSSTSSTKSTEKTSIDTTQTTTSKASVATKAIEYDEPVIIDDKPSTPSSTNTTTTTKKVVKEEVKKAPEKVVIKETPAKPIQLKQPTTTVISKANNESKVKIDVPVTKKPDPTYIYDAKKNENKPIVSKNQITGNLEHFQLNAGAYSSMTAARNLANKIEASCGSTKIIPTQANGQRLFRVICGDSTDVTQLQRIQAKIKPIVSTQLQKVK